MLAKIETTPERHIPGPEIIAPGYYYIAGSGITRPVPGALWEAWQTRLPAPRCSMLIVIVPALSFIISLMKIRQPSPCPHLFAVAPQVPPGTAQ